jgi:hypothetical protein
MFITPVSMPCTESHYKEFLEKPLKEMGYATYKMWENCDEKYICTNFSHNALMITTHISHLYRGRYCIPEFNPDLFLALAAMTDSSDGVPGEYWKYIGDNNPYFTKNKIYKQIDDLSKSIAFIDNKGLKNGFCANNNIKNFTKATKQEIINHFKPTKMKEIEELKSQINQLSETIKIIEAQIKETQKEEDKNAFIKKFNAVDMSEMSKNLFGSSSVMQILDGCTPSDKPELEGRAFYVHNNYEVKTGKTEEGGTYISIYKKIKP